MLAGRDFISIGDLGRSELRSLLELAVKLKSKSGSTPTLSGKVVGLLFEKPSTRTRVSFETAVYQLGGQPIYLRADELQLARGEPLKDTARVLGSYLNGLVMRTYDHENLVEFAEYAPVPIINALSDFEHPTQIISDMLTIVEVKGKLSGLRFVWLGDGNNVCNSWLLAGATMGMNIVVSCPKGFDPAKSVLTSARKLAAESGGEVELVRNPDSAVEGADILYTDVWVSMGQEKGGRAKEKKFKAYQLNSNLVTRASDDCSVMHCLPAHRGLEITEDVLEGKRSIVWRQSENKLHGAKAVLTAFLT